MQKVYEALLDQLDELHRLIHEALDEMPSEALDWSPGPDMNSLSVLIVHLAGAERYWVGDVVKGEPSFRDRSAEFRTKGLNAAALTQHITNLAAYEAKAFQTMSLADLEQECVSPRDGRTYTVALALNHALKHTAIHVGHIQILVQLWKQREPGKGEAERERD